MAFGDIYELIDVQTLAGQTVLNVYFYRQNNLAVTADAQDLIDSYVGQVLPEVAGVQTDNVLHTEIRCRNLFNPVDNAVEAISVAGADTSNEGMTNFDAVGYALSQNNGSVKNGAKRYAGLPEGAQNDGVIDEPVYIALLTTLAAALTGTLDVGIVGTWLPIIVKRIAEGGGDYRLPANAGEAVFGEIISAVFNPVVTSQVSRKLGVGE